MRRWGEESKRAKEGAGGNVASLTCFSSDGCESYCYHSSWVWDEVSYPERGGRRKWEGERRGIQGRKA